MCMWAPVYVVPEILYLYYLRQGFSMNYKLSSATLAGQMSSRDLPVATLPLWGLKECAASLPPQLMLSIKALVRKAGPQACRAGTWPAEPSLPTPQLL